MTAEEYQPRPISVNAAAKKYGVPQGTLSRWAQRGIVKVLQKPKGHGYKMFIDEASVALAAQYYRPPVGRLAKRGFNQVRDLPAHKYCPFCGKPLDIH